MEAKIEYIKEVLSHKIIAANSEFKDKLLVKCDVELPQNIDGFMSYIFLIKLTLKSKVDESIRDYDMVFKLIKFGDEERKDSNVNDQFQNENFVYGKFVPYGNELLTKAGAKFSMDNIVPHTYYAKYEHDSELSQFKESYLVMENLIKEKFRMGPRVHLDEKHLVLMAEAIGRYHSLTYAMRISKDPKLDEFKKEIIPISFLNKKGEVNEWNYLYVIGFERFNNYILKNAHHMDEKFEKDIQLFRDKYWEKPYALLEKLRIGSDDTHSVILHGDYLRNNVMFKYDEAEGFENPLAVKMLDFQEMRYASPALDISLFMFFNMNESQFHSQWDKILKCYHNALIDSLVDLLKTSRDDPRLEVYSFENFMVEFKKFALYGALVSMHFTPWMTATPEECERISVLVMEDLKCKEFKDLTLTSGGQETDEFIVAIMKHASRMGYFDNWY